MLVVKNNKHFMCTAPEFFTLDSIKYIIKFKVVEHLPPAEIKNIFLQNDFYIRDTFLEDVVFDAQNNEFEYLHITYQNDSTYKIKIKFIKKELKI